MTHKGSKKLITERLVLRRVRISDYKDMFEYLSKEEVARYVTWSPHKDPSETKKLLIAWRKRSFRKDHYRWCITLDKKVIGNIDVVFQLDNTAVLGWQLDNIYWNKGFVTEAAIAVRDYLFNVVGFEAIEACHIEGNVASGRVMQKIGMSEIPYYESKHYKIRQQTEHEGQKLVFYKLNNK